MKNIILATILVCAATSAHAQDFSANDLARRTVERRAVEAANWGMSAVNYDLMLQEMLNKTDGKVNQVIYWSRPLDWHNQTLTPNPDAIYFINPGSVDTDRFRHRLGIIMARTGLDEAAAIEHHRSELNITRFGQPADIAGPAFFLCSDDARYVTGQILLVDGGVSATF